MKSFAFCLLLASIWPLSAASAQQGWPLPSQEAVAVDLRSADIQTLMTATNHAAHLPIEKWSPALRSSILYALEREILRDIEAARAGQYRWFDEPLRLQLAELVIAMQEPAAIPSLVLMAGESRGIRRALVDFGREALPHLLRVARAEGKVDRYSVWGCLRILHEMIQQRGLEYFTPRERAQLKAVAALYLVSNTPSSRTDWDYVARSIALRRAAILALALEDEEARTWVERLVADPGAFPDKEAAQHTIKKARQFDPSPLGDFIEAFDKRHR